MTTMAELTLREREALTAALEAEPNYRLAEFDTPFLETDVARPARLELELLHAESCLAARRVASTVVVFGGARVRAPAVARAALEAARSAAAAAPADAAVARALRLAERQLDYSRYYDEARELARILSTSHQVEERCEFVVVTGGGPGVMEGANRGAWECGCVSAGFNIKLPFEQRPNPFVTPGLALRFRYFALRKLHFMLRARALVAFPGGYGTFDELFEALTLVQTGKIARIPVVLVGRDFWRRAVDFEFLEAEGLISAEDRTLFEVVDSGAAAAAAIRAFHGYAPRP
jgi:uncharacterized protein (TIGR00730 family)